MNHFLAALKDRIGSRIITSESGLSQYAQSEGHHRYQPLAAVAQSTTIDEVQCLVKHAAEHSLPIVVYGAGTSLASTALVWENARRCCVNMAIGGGCNA